jgi:hypothetical protein
MNRVGERGQRHESVWLASYLVDVLRILPRLAFHGTATLAFAAECSETFETIAVERQ